MNVASLRMGLPSWVPTAPPPGLSARRHSQTAGATPPTNLPVPLSKRPAEHVIDLVALVEWRQRTLAAIHQVGDSWADADGGPTDSQLKVRHIQGTFSCLLMPDPVR